MLQRQAAVDLLVRMPAETGRAVMPTSTLTTSTAIRARLAGHYAWLVERFDPKDRERGAADSLKKRLAPNQCAACGRRPPKVDPLDAAHIEPLAECAEKRLDNLLLLWRASRVPPGSTTAFT